MNELRKFFQRKTSSVSPVCPFRELGNIAPNTADTESFDKGKYSKNEVHPQVVTPPSLLRLFSRDCIPIITEEIKKTNETRECTESSEMW